MLCKARLQACGVKRGLRPSIWPESAPSASRFQMLPMLGTMQRLKMNSLAFPPRPFATQKKSTRCKQVSPTCSFHLGDVPGDRGTDELRELVVADLTPLRVVANLGPHLASAVNTIQNEQQARGMGGGRGGHSTIVRQGFSMVWVSSANLTSETNRRAHNQNKPSINTTKL